MNLDWIQLRTNIQRYVVESPSYCDEKQWQLLQFNNFVNGHHVFSDMFKKSFDHLLSD